MKRTVTVVIAFTAALALIGPSSGGAVPHSNLAQPCGDSQGNGRHVGQIDTSQCLPNLNPTLPEVLPPPPITGHHPPGASPDPILRQIARQVTHSWSDNQFTIDTLENRLEAGERLYITCAPVSRLAQQVLAHNGYLSRLVATVTKQSFNGFDDDHALLEVREGNRWVVYDLDGNLQPLDRDGRGMSIVQLTRAKQVRPRMLAHDQAWDVRGLQESGWPLSIAPYMGRIFRNHLAWYRRILGVPIIQDGDEMVFHDERQRARVESVSAGYHYVDSGRWAPILREELRKGRSVEKTRASRKGRRSP
jgi:hypothetical protein